jgi:hypothetical protein|tara:strand:- start:1597 stop:2058 length:462 start_codon:yes stop_codon:yes gene_type:complete
MNAKEILKNKFWIVEDNRGVKFGTISLNEEQYILSTPSGTQMYHTEKELTSALDKKISWTELDITETVAKEIHGYPTNSTPYNPMFDVKRKLPLFTKSDKSKSLYAAGYYIIKFDKGWVKSFCPKLITVERYTTKGPFKTEIEMRQELSLVNR